MGIVNNEVFSHYAAVVPHDTTNYADGEADALWVGGAGNAVVIRPDGTAITFTGVAAGTLLPVRSIRVNSTLTTATNMTALYTRREA